MPEEETVTCEQFLKLTDDVVAAASASLVAGSAAAERAVYEIIDVSIFKVFFIILTQSSLLLSTSWQGMYLFDFTEISIKKSIL